jgi:hypothetical protein
MAERAIREVDGKRLLSQWLPEAWEKVSVVPDLAPLAGIQGKKPFTVSVENANWALLEAAYVGSLLVSSTARARLSCLLAC